jgi:hypothetical protein
VTQFEQRRSGRSAEVLPGRINSWWWVAAGVGCVAVLVLAMRYGGAIGQSRVTGLPDAGAITAWGLP